MARTTKDTKTQAPAPATQQELQAAGQQPPATTDKKPSASERFTNMVMKQYQSMVAYNFSNRERQLIRNYFICIDQMLQRTEAVRLRKNANNRDHKYDNDLPYTWANLDLPELAQDLAHYARVGLDMIEDNTLFPIPFKNNQGNLYTITLMEGYNGIRYQAEKYALDPFRSVTVEVIFENDEFRPIKKDSKNPVEGYEFNIPQPLNRGDPSACSATSNSMTRLKTSCSSIPRTTFSNASPGTLPPSSGAARRRCTRTGSWSKST